MLRAVLLVSVSVIAAVQRQMTLLASDTMPHVHIFFFRTRVYKHAPRTFSTHMSEDRMS